MKKTLLLMSALFAMFAAYGQVITSFPFNEDFESQAQGPTGCGPTFTIAGNTWQNGDEALPASAGHDVDWTADAGGTGSFGTGPSIDHTLGTSTGMYLYMETSCNGTGYPTADAHLVSPWMDFTNMSAPSISFWRHMLGNNGGTMHVDVDTTNGAGWVLDIIPAIANPNLDQWIEEVASLSAFAGMDSVRVRIREVSGTGFECDFGIDDISVFQPEPHDLAGIGFGTLGCGVGTTAISVEYIQNGTDTIYPGDSIYFSYDDGITAIMNELFITTDTITSGESFTYTFTGMANFPTAGAYSASAWSNYWLDSAAINDTIMSTFNVKPLINTFPYLENFENGTGGWAADNTTNGTWEMGTPNKTVIQGASSGFNAWTSGGLTGDYLANDNSWVDGPCFDFTTLDSGSYVAMKIWWNSEFSWDGSNVQWSLDQGTTWNNFGLFGDPNNWYNDNSINGNPGGSGEGWCGRTSTNNGSDGWVQAKHMIPDTLIGQGSVDIRVTFGSDGSVQDDGFAWDDFSIGLPDSLALDTAMMDYAGCSNFEFDYGNSEGFYNFFHQDTATLAITPIVGQITDGVLMFTNTSGADSTFYLIKEYVDPSGCFPLYDTVLVTLNSTPYNELTDIQICYYDSTMFSVDTASYYTYLWNDVMASTIDSAYYNMQGAVTVTVTDTITGCAHTAEAMVYQTPAVDLATSVALCAGDSTMIDAGTGYAVYAWNTGDSIQMINIPSTAGMYNITTTDSIGCMSMDSIEVIENALPVVDLGADETYCDTIDVTLDAGTFPGYMWNDGSSNQTLVVNTTGNYSVTVTDANGCMGTDDVTITFEDCTSLSELDNGIEVKLFPNPSTGEFKYSLSDITEDVAYFVTDLSGKVVLTGSLTTMEGMIDLSAFENGMYMLNLHSGNSSNTIRLIKQ